MSTALPSLRQPPIGFAHRGARAQVRENTLEAFVLACRLGATGLETDAWLSADGAVVLDHDGRVGRRPWRRAIGDIPRAGLPPHMPLLGDLYEACGNDLELSIDVKGGTGAEEIVAIARRHDASGRLWLCHDVVEELAEWRSFGDEVGLVHSTKLSAMPNGPERHAADLAAAGIDAVNLREPVWTGGMTTLFHRFGVLCFGWDAQHERQIDRLLTAGIDAVYSDHVDRLVEQLTRHAERR